MNTETEAQKESTEVLRLPLWRNCLDEMIREGATFGSAWPVRFFEDHFKEKLGSNKFSFAMIALRGAMLEETAYFLRSSESGKLWDIPGEDWHIITRGPKWASQARRCLAKQIHVVSTTLANPAAKLTEETRKKAEHQLHTASLRLLFFNRPNAVADALKKHAPKVLGPKETED